jgi:hypothetical protein
MGPKGQARSLPRLAQFNPERSLAFLIKSVTAFRDDQVSDELVTRFLLFALIDSVITSFVRHKEKRQTGLKIDLALAASCWG